MLYEVITPVSQDIQDASRESANVSEEEVNLTSEKKESDEVGHDRRSGPQDEIQEEEQAGIDLAGSMTIHASDSAADVSAQQSAFLMNLLSRASAAETVMIV